MNNNFVCTDCIYTAIVSCLESTSRYLNRKCLNQVNCQLKVTALKEKLSFTYERHSAIGKSEVVPGT
jgi:hypothetical protein